MDYLSISVETDVVEKNVTLYCGKVTRVSALVAEVSPWQNYVSKICRHKNGPPWPLVTPCCPCETGETALVSPESVRLVSMWEL